MSRINPPGPPIPQKAGRPFMLTGSSVSVRSTSRLRLVCRLLMQLSCSLAASCGDEQQGEADHKEGWWQYNCASHSSAVGRRRPPRKHLLLSAHRAYLLHVPAGQQGVISMANLGDEVQAQATGVNHLQLLPAHQSQTHTDDGAVTLMCCGHAAPQYDTINNLRLHPLFLVSMSYNSDNLCLSHPAA